MAIEMWNAQQIIFSRFQGDTDQGTIAALPNGNYVVVWRDGLIGQDGVRYQIVNAAGELVTAASQRIPVTGAIDPEITVLSNGEFVISWSRNSEAVEAQRFDINGVAMGAPYVVSAVDGDRDKQAPAMWADDEGLGYMTVWSDTGGTSNSIGLQWKVGAETYTRFVNTGLGAKNPDVTGLGNGKFIVTWSEGNGNDIKAVIVDSVVSEPATYRTLRIGTSDVLGSGTRALVTPLNDQSDGFVIAFRDNSGNLKVRGFNGEGVAANEITLDSGVVDRDFRIVSLTKGGFENGYALAYTKLVNGDERLFVKVVKYDDASIPPVEVQVPGNADARISSITELADGRISITWDDFGVGSGAIYNRIIDAREQVVTVEGTAGADYYIGTKITDADGDTLRGNGGNDRLEGGAGGDDIQGGADNDTAEFRFAKTEGVAASLTTNTGTAGDAAGDMYLDVENFYGSRFNDTFEGSADVNRLTGWTGNDVLDGKGGDDILDGGAGNDTYYVDSTNDQVIDGRGGGSDRVYTTASYFLSSTAEIEALIATGSASVGLAGNGFANAIYGNSGSNKIEAEGGNDVIVGGAGADAMYGGTGNDTFYVDSSSDRVYEYSRGGTDTVRTSVSFTLSSQLENLVAQGTNGVTLKGSSLSNTITGNSGANKIHGGLGNDLLRGGSGKDKFVFDTKPNKSSNVDKIYDFKSRDDGFYLDNKYFTKLGLGSSSGRKFKSDMFVEHSRAKDREDRIVYDRKKGYLYYDQDGTGSKAQVKIATISNKEKLYYHDFFVI